MTSTATAEFRGQSIIAGVSTPGTGSTVQAVNPATEQPLAPEYSLIGEEQLRTATAQAAEAFDSFSDLEPEARATFLETIAKTIEATSEQIISRAQQETGLPEARLTGECGRTAHQLRLFASVVRQGDHHGVRIDPALPERAPMPRADIRQRQIPLGPVAVFGASNFPLAFSTAGGDTASALAAGCPVVFKAHNAHPGTSELVGRAITEAAAECGIHPGVFSLIYGPGASIGQALVADPTIKAVGFTGSRQAGTALAQTAAARPEPIPVYAEMSSINPVFFLSGALDLDEQRRAALASGFVGSVTGSSGQLCTAPGLAFVPSGEAGDRFVAAVAQAAGAASGQTMLTPSIASAWNDGVGQLTAQDGVEPTAQGTPGQTMNAPAPSIFSTGVEEFTANPALHEEIFGAASLIVRYRDDAELHDAIRAMEGQLTATLHLAEADHERATALLPALEHKAGRILANGWPTGVEVGHAMVHGGPHPATSDSRTTSVGSLAIDRFLRPVAYQNIPQGLLPAPLRDENPWALTRRIDGTIQSAG